MHGVHYYRGGMGERRRAAITPELQKRAGGLTDGGEQDRAGEACGARGGAALAVVAEEDLGETRVGA